jgi:PKD repeat protein
MKSSAFLKKNFVTGLAIIGLLYSLTACGGGGVRNQPPTGQLSAELITGPSDLGGPVGTKIRFTATFSDPDGGNVIATIDFGDNSTSVVPSSGASLVHTYTAAGVYQPKLLLQDDDNTPVVTVYVNNDSSYRINIENRPPVAVIVATPAAGPKPLAVSFNGSNSYDPDGGAILNYFWTFNSGGPNCPITTPDMTGATASWVYETEGQFYACLRVVDDEGQTSFATQLIVVRDRVPPIAILRASPTSGITPLTVTFNGGDSYDPDNGTTAGFGITSYEWKFEASTTDQCTTFVQDASGAVTQHTYVNNGPREKTFTAILRVRDDDTPVSQIACDSVTITVQPNPPPIANIAANPTRGPVPLTVSVNGSASYDPDGGAIVLFEWDFNSDASCSTFTRDQTGATAQWTYNTAGTWFICLRVTDDEGLTSTTVQQINAGGNPPVAVINANPTWSNDSPLTVFFDGRSSYDPDGLNLISYVWNFGDNTGTQSGATAQHTYTCPDAQIGAGGCTWSATLTVTDAEGLQNTASQAIVISANPAPVAVLTATPNSGTAPLQVTFDASASHDPDPTNVITAYQWSPSVGGCTTPGGTATFNFACTFDTNGIWTISVTVTDDEGLTDTNSVQIFVGFNPPPVAVFSATPAAGPQPLTVNLDATASYDPDGGAITLYEWDFETGGASFAPGNATAVHVYTCTSSPPCTFTAALRVTDDDAPAAGPRTATATQTIYVGGRAPVAIINANPTWSNISPMTVSFNGSASFDPDGLPLVSYTWNFGDGSPTQTGSTASHTYYAIPGPYCFSVTPPNCTWNATLTVVDREGLSNTATQPIIISNNPAPIAILTATPTWGGNPLNVTFDGSASHDPDLTNILTYSWSPSVGGCTTPTTSVATFSCLFNVDGAHTVTLTVTDDENLSDSASVTIFVNVNPPPIAVINAPATTCQLAGPSNSCVLTFHGGNSYDPDNGTNPGAGITLYEWDTNGDFTFESVGSTVTATYTTPGPVVVTLRVTDDDSNVAGGPFTDIESIVVTILGNPNPVAMVSCQPTFGIAAFSFTCTGIQSHDPDATNVITLYEWAICDGSGSAPPCTATNVTPTTGTGVIYTATFDPAASGVYTVNLQVTDDEGNTDTEQAILNVGANPPPIAVATATPSFCTAPCDVTLNGGGSFDPDATNVITAYSWTITGPGTNFSPSSSTSSSFVVHFNPAANGVYTANLLVTDDEGLPDTVSVSIYINLNPPPVAVLNAPATTCMISGPTNSCVLTFSGQKSYDPDEGMPPSDGQGITNYEWDPDGGTPFDHPELDGSTTITWTYSASGSFPVALRVTDNDGLTNTTVMWVTILANPDPVAAISCTPTFGTAPFSVTCHGADSFDPDQTNIITNYSWSISGGNGNVTPTSFTGLIYTFSFNPAATGVYTVTLVVTDDETNADTEFATINVGANPPPIAVATATPSFCQAPCNITLNGSGSYDPDATNIITGHQWAISGPDINYSVPAGVQPGSLTHDPCTDPSDPATFAIHFNSNASGVYTADLSVCDDDALTDTVSVSMFINVNPPPVAVLAVSPTSCTLTGSSPSCSVTADGSNSYDPDNTTGGISNYSFDCGNSTGSSGSAPTATCTYTAPGTYVLILTVTDDDTPSQTDTASSFVTVFSNPPPVAVIESDRTHGGEPLTVLFTGLSSFDPDATNIIASYSWDFNDTGLSGPEVPADCTDVDSTDASPTHTFLEVGTYLVCLTVTDDEGLSNTATLMIIVGGSDIPPVAVLNASPTFGDAPLTVAFDATGSHDPDNANPPAGIVLYEYCVDSAAFPTDCNAWASPTYSSATLTSVNHTYTANGTYIAKLRVTDDEGSTNVASLVISVGVNPPPVAVIQASPTVGYQPPGLTVTFNGCNSDDPDNPGSNDGIVDWEWDFNSDGDFSDVSGVEWTGPNEGSSAPSCTQIITYVVAGTYVATLRVTDDDSAVFGGPFTDTATIFITVNPNPNPVAVPSCSPTTGAAPFNFVCNGGNSFDPDNTNIITNYSWSVSGPLAGFVSPPSGTGVIFSGNVASGAPSGTFIVTLTVTDDESLIDSEDVNFFVNANPGPIACGTATPTFGNVPITITFDGSCSFDQDGEGALTYSWSFCDSGSSSGVTAAHLFTSPLGACNNTLTVTDNESLSDTVTITVWLNVNPPPVAQFTCDITTGITPFTVTCDGSASFDQDGGAITAYAWDFTFHDSNNSAGCAANYPTAPNHINLGGNCDGVTSNADEPAGDFNTLPNTDDSEGARDGAIATFTYTEPGLYIIMLKVTDDDSSVPGGPFTDTASLVLTARDQPPSATIDVDPIACPAGPAVPCTFTLRANNSKDPDSATSPLPRYEWDFDYPNPLASSDPNHLTKLDFCYRQGTPFTVDAVGTQVEFQTDVHGLHIIALRVTDDDDQPWANDPDDDSATTVVGPTHLGEDNHACAAVSVLVKNPDFPPTVKVDIVRDLVAPSPVRNAPYPEGTDNAPAGWDPTDQAIPNDDEFLANPANCTNNDPGCVQLAIWIEDPGVLGSQMTVAIDWDADGDETTRNFEYALCTLDPGVSGDVVASINNANFTFCIPHPTLNPGVTFAGAYSFIGSNGVTYIGPPQFAYTTSGRHHIVVLVCDNSDPDNPLANCSEGDKTIEALKLHPAVEINYDLSGCEDSPDGSSTLDSTCEANINVLWNDPDGPALGTDCPTCVVEVDCDFSDANGNNNGTLEWPDHLGNLGDFTADFSSNQTGETDHVESDATCRYTDPTRNTYVVVTRFLDDDSPNANIATATTTIVVRSTPPTIEITHSENDTTFSPDGSYDGNDDLVGNPNTIFNFQICADDSDDGAYADAYAAGGGGADASTKWFFVNFDALPGGDGNDPVGSPFGYGDNDPNFGPGFDVAVSSPNCITIGQVQYPNQGRYVIHVRVLDDECHSTNDPNIPPQFDCDANDDGVPEPDNPAVNIGVNASDAWLTLIVVNEPPVIWGDFFPSSDPPSIDPTLQAVQALTNNVFSIHFDAVDPDGGTVRVYYNLDSNLADTDPNARPNTTGHRVDQYTAGSNPTDPASCTNDPDGAFPNNWDGFVDDTTPVTEDFIGPFSYTVAGRFCVRLMALDDEESAATLANPVANPPNHPAFATFMLVVVNAPPALAVRVDDNDTTSNYGLNSAFDAVGVIGTTFTFRVFADDPDGLQNPAADSLTVTCNPGANVPAPVGAAADFAENGGDEDQWTLTPVLVNLGPDGRITCTFTYTDDEGSSATAKATILVVQSPPVVDVQVWDDNDTDPTTCDNPANSSAACRDAVSTAPRFYSLYVRAEDPDNLQNPANDNLRIDCPTIDTDPGVGTTPLSQIIANPTFATNSPIEGFTNTERVDLDGDSTNSGTQPFSADQAGQHICRIIYCDDEDTGTCGDNYPSPVFGQPPSCNDGASPDTPPFNMSEACALVTITIQGNTAPTALIDVRPENTNSPAIFQPGTHRRASSGFTERLPQTPPSFSPETNLFVFRASIFDADENQQETDCAYYGGAGCPGFTFEWDLNNDGVFETNTAQTPEVSVVYCDGFANGAAAGTNWAAAPGNADPGTPATCGNNGTPDQKLIKVGLRVTDDEGQTNTAWMTIALHDTAPWAEIDVDNSGGNDLLVPDNSVVDLQFNGNDPDSPGELMLYEFECGDDGLFDEFSGFVLGGTTLNLSITYGSAITNNCVVSPGNSVTGTLRITDEEGNVRTATTTISINNAAGSPPGVEVVVDATSNPLLDLNVCFAPCPVSATVFWEDTVGAGNVSGTVTWGDGNTSNFTGGFVGSATLTNTYLFPGVFTVTVSVTDSDSNTSTATAVQVVLDRAPSVDIDVLDLGGPAGSPGPDTDPRDNANILIVTPNGGTVTLTADRNMAGTALDDDTFDYEYHPNALTPADATNNFQFDWWCDVNGDGIAQAGEIQSGINLTTVTYGPFPVGSTLRRCLLRLGDDERGALNGYSDPTYNQPFGLCGAETAGVSCPANVNPPSGFAWNNDLWSSEAEINIVVRDDPPSAYILEFADGPPAGNDGDPTPSQDDFSGVLGTSGAACSASAPCYSVDFRIYGVDPDGQPIDRLVDCEDDGTFEQRPFDQTTALFDGLATCSYTTAGRYRLRARNITDVNDTDPTNNLGAQADALVTVVVLDLPTTAFLAEAPGADGPPPGNDGDPSDTFDDWTGTVPPAYTVDIRTWGIDGDTTIGGNAVDRLVDCDGDAGGSFAFVRIADNVTTAFTDTTCVYTAAGVYPITLRVLSDPLDTDPAPPASSAACDASAAGFCADAFGQAVIFNWVPSASIEDAAGPDDATNLFGAPPLTVFLDDGPDHSIDLDGGNLTCRWDCDNDGTFEASGGGGATCPDLNGGSPGDVTCTYAVAGTYIARIVVEDDEFANGDTTSRSTATASIVVFDKPPSADIDENIGTGTLEKAENWNNPLWLYATGGPGAPITLSGMGADEGAGSGNNVYCSWTSTGPAPLTSTISPTTSQQCSFAAPDQQDFEATVAGYYEVTLFVEDNEDNDPGCGTPAGCTTPGNVSQARYPLVVFDYNPTISIKAAEDEEGCPQSGDDPNPTELVNGFNGFDSDGNPLTKDAFCFYTDNLSNPDGDPTLTVSWDFDWSDAPSSGGNGDGVLNEADCDGSGGIGNTISNTYTSVGQFRVCAIATDSTGNSSFAHLTIEVNDGQSDGKPSDPYVNVNCQETPPIDPVVPLPFPPCPADDPTCSVRAPTLVDTNPAVFTCDAFADDPDDRTLGHQDPNGPDLSGSPHQSEEDGNPAGPDIVKYCWYIWQVTDAKTGPHTAFNPRQNPIADCDNQIVPDLDNLNTRTPVLRFVNTGSYYLEVHVFDEGNTDTDNWCDLDITTTEACVDGNCEQQALSTPETNCAVGSITLFVTEQRPAAALHKLDPSYGWPEGVGGFTTEVIGKTACLPPSDPTRRVGFHWSWGDGAFFGDDNPGYVCDPPLQEVHSNSAFHTYVSPGQFYIVLSVRDLNTQAESQATSTVVGTDWPLFP